jgi:hypothetical protein
LGTPLSLPLSEQFTVIGPPNPGIWINTDAEVNDKSVAPPSPPYALNLNSSPYGEDMVELKPVDLSGLEGMGLRLSYFYQPQGASNAPEPEDSLRVYFKNDQGSWVRIKSYPGSAMAPFVEEVIDIESAPNGGGSYFHGQFQVRFRSTGGASPFSNDDWFIDNVQLEIPLGISEQTDLPDRFAVYRNYPNPFNPTTTIRFDLPVSGKVSLTIYSILGQKIRTVVNNTLEAGTHEVQWDGRSDTGAPVASGVYIYRFETDNFVRSYKMILLK